MSRRELFTRALARECMPTLTFLRELPESGDLAIRRADHEEELIAKIMVLRAGMTSLVAQLHECRGLAIAEAKAAWTAEEISSARTFAAGKAPHDPDCEYPHDDESACDCDASARAAEDARRRESDEKGDAK